MLICVFEDTIYLSGAVVAQPDGFWVPQGLFNPGADNAATTSGNPWPTLIQEASNRIYNTDNSEQILPKYCPTSCKNTEMAWNNYWSSICPCLISKELCTINFKFLLICCTLHFLLFLWEFLPSTTLSYMSCKLK